MIYAKIAVSIFMFVWLFHITMLWWESSTAVFDKKVLDYLAANPGAQLADITKGSSKWTKARIQHAMVKMLVQKQIVVKAVPEEEGQERLFRYYPANYRPKSEEPGEPA